MPARLFHVAFGHIDDRPQYAQHLDGLAWPQNADDRFDIGATGLAVPECNQMCGHALGGILQK
jgi:hypothetical protein